MTRFIVAKMKLDTVVMSSEKRNRRDRKKLRLKLIGHWEEKAKHGSGTRHVDLGRPHNNVATTCSVPLFLAQSPPRLDTLTVFPSDIPLESSKTWGARPHRLVNRWQRYLL